MERSRFYVMQIVGVAVFIAAFLQGWPQQIYAMDQTGVINAIMLMFFIGLINLHSGTVIAASKCSDFCVRLGLFGTVVGLVIAFSEVDASVVGDAQQAGKLAAEFLKGLGVALSTTIAGWVCSLWIDATAFLMKGSKVS